MPDEFDALTIRQSRGSYWLNLHCAFIRGGQKYAPAAVKPFRIFKLFQARRLGSNTVGFRPVLDG